MTNAFENRSRPRRVTAQMVADKAGVSRSAVSRAFTDGGYVDAAKRARIFAVASDLGYQPNALAAGLQGGRSRLVAVIAGDMRSAHDTSLVNQLCAALNQQELWPLLVADGGSGAGIKVEESLRFPLDAIIIRGGSMTEDFVNRCVKLNIPMICYGRPMPGGQADAVYCRNRNGMRQITELLIAKGRRRFGFIAGPDGFYASQERQNGLTDALTAARLSLLAQHRGDYTVEGGYASALALVDAVPDLDAIVCSNDATAIGTLDALRDRGIAVPDAVSVTGFDDIEMAGWPAIGLTTVRNPLRPTVSAIVELLRSRQDAPDRPNATRIVETELILRKTH